jgi:hypothetical protein
MIRTRACRMLARAVLRRKQQRRPLHAAAAATACGRAPTLLRR